MTGVTIVSEFIFDGVDPISLQMLEEEGYTDEDALDLAQGLLMDAVPCLTSIYADFREAQKKMVKFAILEMAKFIKIDYFNFERSTSPFQSETIGSYTYSKMSTAVRASTATGVPAFDRAVAQLGELCEIESGGSFSSTSEQVAISGYQNFVAHREKLTSAPDWYKVPDSSIEFARVPSQLWR